MKKRNFDHRFEQRRQLGSHSRSNSSSSGKHGDSQVMNTVCSLSGLPDGDVQRHDASHSFAFERNSAVLKQSSLLKCRENNRSEEIEWLETSGKGTELGVPKNISSLGAVYKFSWKVFQEPSYADVISMKLIQNSGNDESEEGLRKKVLSEVSKVFLKSPEEKNVEHQHLVKDLKTIKKHCPAVLCDGAARHTLQFYHGQELIEEHRASVLTSKLSERYSNIQKLFKNASVAIDEAEAVHLSQDVVEKKRQHKLLVLALLSQTSVSSSVYRVGGSANPAEWMYKKIHFVGDSQVHNLYCSAAWEGVATTRPHFHCKDDLSLFTLMEVLQGLIPKVSVKGKMLVVCSVGLRDVVRSIDALGVLVTLENTLTDMKKIREEFKSFYGDEHDLLFANILPLDVCKLVELHKNALQAEETEELVSQCNETTLRLVKFAYLLTQNMMTEDLSRIRHLPAWELFVHPVDLVFEDSRVKLTSLSDGVEPSMKQLRGIARRVTHFHQSYCGLAEPPHYNTTQRLIFFVCNEKYSAMDKFWPKKKIHEKPTFIFLKQVTLNTISKSLEPHFPLPEGSILVVWFDASQLFRPYSVSDCTCSSASLCLDLPHFLTPEHIYDALILKRKNLEKGCGSPNVVLTTLCPVNYLDYLKSQLSDHGDACRIFEAPSDSFLQKINKYLLSVVDAVNLRIVQSNRMRGLPAWDLCSFLYKREQDGSLAFVPSVSPCDRRPAMPQTAAKIMICLSQCGQNTVRDLNWLDFCKSATYSEKKKASRNDRDFLPVSHARSCSPVHVQPEFRCTTRSKSPTRALSLTESSAWHTETQDPHRLAPSIIANHTGRHGHLERNFSQPPSSSYDSREDTSRFQFKPVDPEPYASSGYSEAFSTRSHRAEETLDEPLPKRFCHEDFDEDSQGSGENSPSQILSLPLPTTSASSDSSDFFKVDEKVLEKLVASLRAAHEVEVSKLRTHPQSHSKYEQQRSEFIEHALKIQDEHHRPLEMDSIERVWVEYWRLKLETSFTKTWEKRVSHLVNMIGGGKPLDPKTMETLSRLTRIEEPSENSSRTGTLMVAESNLLNKFRKHKRTVADKLKNDMLPRVVLGKRMLAQVQKNWRSTGCKASQNMLESALARLDDFASSAQDSFQDREQYDKLRIDIGSFKTFLQKKEKNPFDLDLKSISEITKGFGEAETFDYVENVLKLKGIENPAKEDVALTCQALKSVPPPKIAVNFIQGPRLQY